MLLRKFSKDQHLARCKVFSSVWTFHAKCLPADHVYAPQQHPHHHWQGGPALQSLRDLGEQSALSAQVPGPHACPPLTHTYPQNIHSTSTICAMGCYVQLQGFVLKELHHQELPVIARTMGTASRSSVLPCDARQKVAKGWLAV